jgi:futalosine hydrolase
MNFEPSYLKRKILIVTATEIESLVFKRLASPSKEISLEILITGVGTIATARSLSRYFALNEHPVLAVNAGIAGSYNQDLIVGSAAIVNRDCFADFGVDDHGEFIPAIRAGLVDDENPFDSDGWIENNNIYTRKLVKHQRFITGITSDTVSGSDQRIDMIKNRFNPDIESMEGASFCYICALERVPYVALRAVSNMVEERDRKKWHIPLALGTLREKAEEVLKLLFTAE